MVSTAAQTQMVDTATSPPDKRTIVATITLISFNVIVFIALPLLFKGQYPKNVVAMGSDWGPATFNGEWWRLITSSFVHFDAVHLLANMVILYLVGTRVESRLGALELLSLYVGCGIGGDLVILSADPFSASFGASASVAGFVGALLAISLDDLFSKAAKKKAWITTIVLVLLVSYTIALDAAGRAYWSHTVSLGTGALVTFALTRFEPKTIMRRAVILVFALVLISTTFAVGYRFERSWGSSSSRP